MAYAVCIPQCMEPLLIRRVDELYCFIILMASAPSSTNGRKANTIYTVMMEGFLSALYWPAIIMGFTVISAE